jgi:hypothetical protein
MSKPRVRNRPRNPLYNHPLLHKGGVHRKTQKAQRQQAKQQLKRNPWDERMALINSVMRSFHIGPVA